MNSQRLMRKMVVVLTVFMAGWSMLILGGCRTVGESTSEVNIRHRRVIDNNFGRVQDDIDTVFLLDRPSRLSDQPVR